MKEPVFALVVEAGVGRKMSDLAAMQVVRVRRRSSDLGCLGN